MTRLNAIRQLPCLLVLALAMLAGPVAPALAQGLVIDLTSHIVGITTGFTGTAVVLFGTTDRPGDIIAVARGPDREVTVRRKSRIAGIWANTASATFADVPSFYAVAATRPLDALISPAVAAHYQIGLDHLRFVSAGPSPQVEQASFAQALLRLRQRQGLFAKSLGKVRLLANRLFRATIKFPSNVPTGTYQIKALLVRDGRVVGSETTQLVVSKVGIDAAVFQFATDRPASYGAIAVLMALMAGWLAGLVFRRV